MRFLHSEQSRIDPQRKIGTSHGNDHGEQSFMIHYIKDCGQVKQRKDFKIPTVQCTKIVLLNFQHCRLRQMMNMVGRMHVR